MKMPRGGYSASLPGPSQKAREGRFLGFYGALDPRGALGCDDPDQAQLDRAAGCARSCDGLNQVPRPKVGVLTNGKQTGL